MDLLEREWYIEAPWGRICIVAWGNCFDPPVLLCHGQLDSAAIFRPLLRYLPSNFCYIAMELPGNGKSDHFPKGLMVNAYDLVYSIRVVVRHFRWKQFAFVGHSISTLLGKLYNLAHPGEMSAVVDLDPTPAYETWEPEDFSAWYHQFFTMYFNAYQKFNAPKETAPKYTKQQAIAIVRQARGMPENVAVSTIERFSEPVGEGLIRFTFDQRLKLITKPPLSASYKEMLFTSITTPTLAIIAESSLKLGFYNNCPFALDEKSYPTRNYRVKKVDGNHEVHVWQPEKIAKYVGALLVGGLEGLDALSAKL